MKTILLSMFLFASCASFKGDLEFKKETNLFYAGTQDMRQQGDVYVPVGAGPFSGVVLVHGGGWQSRDRKDMNSIAESLAANGFVVFNINYRFSPKNKHPAPIDDLQSAIQYFKANAQKYKFESSKLGLWGYSSGGHTVSYYALTRAADPNLKVSAVVSGGAPYDFTWYPHSPYINAYTGFYRDQNLKLYFDASATNQITKDAPPFYLYHAEKDRLVEWVQMTSFAAKLKKENIEVKSHSVKFWGHAMAFAMVNEPLEKGIKFLKKKLD